MLAHPMDRGVGQRGGEMEALRRRPVIFDRHGSAIEPRLPIIALAAEESVEIFEAERGRPMVERADRRGLPFRRVVPLAEAGGGIAVILEDFGDRRGAVVPDAVIAG